MSYHATGAEVIEWIGGIAIPTIPITPTKLRASARRRQVLRADLGACCSSCAQGGLGATPESGAQIITNAGDVRRAMSSQTVLTAPAPPFVPPPPPPGITGAFTNASPIAKLLVLGGVGLGAFLLIRKFRGTPKAA